MPAVSKKQQRFFGYLLSNPDERKKRGISKKAAKDFAQHVKEGEIADKLRQVVADMKAADRKAGLLPGGKEVIDLDVERQRRRKKKVDEEKKSCPEGQYYCFDMGKCRPIPKGKKVRGDGELVNEVSPQKVMDFKTFMSIAEGEFAPQRKNHPKELSKKLPKGYSYSDPKREGKHSTSKLQVKQKGKKEPTDTDIKVTGSVIGDKGGTSFWKKHTRARNTLKGIDREVKRIRSQKKEKTPAQRMDKAYDRRVKAKGRQVLGDITKLGKSKNPRPEDK